MNNNGVDRTDYLGMATISAGAYETAWDLSFKKEYELYPGGPKQRTDDRSWGLTLMKYRVNPECCLFDKSRNEYRLKSIHLEIYSEVHLLGQLNQFGSKLPEPDGRIVTPDMNIFAYEAELDHVRDYEYYATKNPKPLHRLNIIENDFILDKRVGFGSQEECRETVTEKVMSDNTLRGYAQEANIDTVKRWDVDKSKGGEFPPHTYPGLKWLDDYIK